MWPWGEGEGEEKRRERGIRGELVGHTDTGQLCLTHTHTHTWTGLELWKDRSPSRHMFQFHFNFATFLLANYICFLIAGSNSIITYTYMLLISQNQINLPEKY
jgi:hypothetical protein